jgi:hypothetical protein
MASPHNLGLYNQSDRGLDSAAGAIEDDRSMTDSDGQQGLLHRVGERDRPAVRLEIDGTSIEARQGDTLLVALLTNRHRLRESEFGDGFRAGFCLMQACQDCWVLTADGERLRACGTVVADGMRIATKRPPWPNFK